jgi:hypothetical protein
MLSPSLASASASTSSPYLSASFSCKASELLEALKGADALRKSAPDSFGLLGASVFLSDSQSGIRLEAFHCYGMGALLAWLPSGQSSGSFSLPLLPLLSFVKATKGKGSLAFSEGKLSASASGASLSLPAGPCWEAHPDQNESHRRETYCLASLASAELPADSMGFALSPFLLACRFASTYHSKQALMGAGFYGESFYGTDGFSLRKAPASLPAFPKASAFPAEAWLPSWLLPIVEAFAKPAERESLLGFYFPEKRGAQALRFWTKAGLCVALRFPTSPGSFPKCDGLFPDRLPFSFKANTKAFLSAVESLLEGLKASDGEPRIELALDGRILEVELSATLQKNVGSRSRPELEDFGKQEASFRCESIEAPTCPSFDAGFFDLPESQQTMAREKHWHPSRLLINGRFLQKALKSFLLEGESISFQWKDGQSPLLLSAFTEGSKALIMPIQRRR